MTVELIQLAGGFNAGDITPVYEMVNIGEFGMEQRDPRIDFYGFRQMSQGPGKFLEEAVLNSGVGGEIRGELGMKSGFGPDTIEMRLAQKREEADKFRFKNIYKFWEIDKLGDRAIYYAFDGLSVFSLGAISSQAGGEWLGAIFASAIQGYKELERRLVLNLRESRVNELEENLERYETFKDNVAHSGVRKVIVPQAQDIADAAKTVGGHYATVNYAAVNSDLIEAYKAAGLMRRQKGILIGGEQ